MKAAKEIKKYQVKCPECGSTDYWFDREKGEAGCQVCGYVFDDEYIQLIIGMNVGPEWRAFTLGEKKSRSRVGPPTAYSVHDKGLSTAISHTDRDAHGRKLPYYVQRRMWRLRKWQIRTRVHTTKDRNLAMAMQELDRLSDKLHIPFAVKERAAMIYRKALDEDLVRGRAINAVTAAALYAACRVTKTPRSLNEVAEASLVKKGDVSRCYRILLKELNIRMPIADPLIYVSKIAEKVGISGFTQGFAIKIIQEAKSKGEAAGKDPQGLAAAALYIACKETGERKTQKDLAEAAGVTEVTLRNRYKTLKRRLKL
jgi:transcription initiation factor TFIIB